jgi:hypothetical protein
LIAACRSTSEWKAPRCSRRRVSEAKKVSTAFAQEQEVGSEVKRPARVPGKPGTYFAMLVDGVVVEDGVDQLAGGHHRLDPVEETNELLVPMSGHTLADHRAVEDIERRKQGGCAVPDIIVGHCPGPTFFIGKPGWVRSSAHDHPPYPTNKYYLTGATYVLVALYTGGLCPCS